jgi:cell division protein FtsL
VLRRLRARGFQATASLAIAIGVCMALLHVSVRLRVIRVGYALSQETQIRHDLMEQNQRLRLELAARKDPGTIERLARERLKMVPPDPGAIRVVRTGKDGRP